MKYRLLKLLGYICLSQTIFTFPFSYCQSQDMENILQQGFEKGITVDLREPVYVDGSLKTEKGGVISAPQLRIQAIQLCYTRKKIDKETVWTIEAEGDLIVEFGDYVFVGKQLIYDFEKKEGVIYEGKTSVEPWYFGGERLELKADGSYLIYNGYVTTSEHDIPDWGIYSHVVCVEHDRYMKARQVHVKVFDYNILWIPSFKANLDSIFDNPIRYRFRWGGRQGPRFGLTYEIFSWERWKTFVRFDYRLTRGPGGGIETYYRSPDHLTEFQSINYLAKDSSILKPHEKARYRLEGVFKKIMDNNSTKILFSYDKISDKDMPSSYYDRDFDFDTAEKTQLLVRKQEKYWISNFYARIRINSFQTVKEELPTFEVNFKPFELFSTGIIVENWASASYLDFKYSKFLIHTHDYSSTRFQYFPTLYRPFILGRFLTITPEAGMITIFYGNSQQKEEKNVILGKAALNFQTQLYRYYGSFKHVIEPYVTYRYFSSPTSSPHEHFIFDLSDGWTRLDYLSFGIHNIIYKKNRESGLSRIFSLDVFSFAFFDTKKICQTIPRIYGRLTIFTLPTIKHVLDTAWNLEHQQMDHFNFLSKWTLSDDFAISFEYRHRGPFSWRKVDQENFFLDVFRSESQLRHSPVSDRRDTILVHFFYRFHPNWACELTSRQGWNRRHEPSYFEYEIDLLTTIQTAWHLRFSFQHQENDNRIAMYLNVGLKRPDQSNYQRKTLSYD